MIWIGKISSEAIAGVTIFATVFWMVEILNSIIGTSSVSLISQSFGAGDMKKCTESIEQTLIFKALVAIVAALLLFPFLKPLMGFFTKEETVIRSALDYGYIRIFFLPVLFSSFTVNTALRSTGDAKSPFYIMLFASILNIILDPVLMFEQIPGTRIPGFGLGIFGAALATVISTTVAFAIGLYLLMSGRSRVKISVKGILRLNKSIDIKLMTIGLPTGIEIFFRQAASMLTLKFISLYGTFGIAAMGIGNRLFGFAFMPLLGLMFGGSTIVGQNLGAENVLRAEKTAYSAAVTGAGLMLLLSGTAMIFPRAIMSLFISDPEVISIGILMIRITAPGFILTGFTLGLATTFTGSGYNMPFLISSILGKWVIQIPILFICIYVLRLDILFIWISFLAAEAAEFCAVLFLFKQGKWKKRRVT